MARLADARADADQVLSAADVDAQDRLARARDEAAALLVAARVDGAREAAERLARQRAATRREAREIVLAARRRALDELRDRARAAARDLVDEDSYQQLLDRLRFLAVTQLGVDGEVVANPDGEPGIIVSDGARRVDYRLVTLADRAVASLGADIATLWT
jgi:vacuolar-type H+-ATPase subunit H